VNVHDWHRTGLLPPFATVEQWIHDQLGYAGAEDEAVYAISLREAGDRGGAAVRILIATDRGLFDMLWERPEAVAERHLTTRQYRWADVRGFHLIAETRLDPETFIRRQPAWRLEIAEPAVEIDGSETQALLEFWETCTKHLDKVSGG
jgi:hypothetical protein